MEKFSHVIVCSHNFIGSLDSLPKKKAQLKTRLIPLKSLVSIPNLSRSNSRTSAQRGHSKFTFGTATRS